jgi:5-methylthioadenosine/S-adenosylhomocysteine deaminase
MGLTVENALLDGERVGVRCVDGAIEALGADVAAQPGDQVLDPAGAHLVPPLVNGHTHAAMTLFRGSGGDLPLMPWLEEKIWPVEARLSDEDVYRGARLACAEMLRSGTTRFWDMYWHPAATARAVSDAGMRATIGAPLFDLGGTPADLRGEAVQIHLSETEQEVQDCLAAHGTRPAFHLDRLGLLSARTVLAHGVWLDPEELALIAERGATVVTNPVANMKLAVGGVFPYPAARAAGVAVGLGTDGAGSNDSLDLLADLKTFALVQKHAAADPTAIDAGEAWAVATGALAPRLGATKLEPGAPADFLLLRADAPELAIGELTADLVYAAAGAVVDTTVVAGRVLMRGGEIEGLEEIVVRAAEHGERLGL